MSIMSIIDIVIATCRFLHKRMQRVMHDMSYGTMPRVMYGVSYDTWNKTRGPWYLTRGFVEICHVACHVSMCYVYCDKCPLTRILQGMVIATCVNLSRVSLQVSFYKYL